MNIKNCMSDSRPIHEIFTIPDRTEEAGQIGWRSNLEPGKKPSRQWPALCDEILPYLELGLNHVDRTMKPAPAESVWFAIIIDGEMVERINGANVEIIRYKPPKEEAAE